MTKVLACIHHVENRSKQLEVVSFRGDEWIVFEERNDPLAKIEPPPHEESCKRETMVVMSLVLVYEAAFEELLETFEYVYRMCALRDNKLVLDLPAESCCGIAHH